MYDFTSRPLKPKPFALSSGARFHQPQYLTLLSRRASRLRSAPLPCPALPRHTNQGAKNKRRATAWRGSLSHCLPLRPAASSSRRPRRATIWSSPRRRRPCPTRTGWTNAAWRCTSRGCWPASSPAPSLASSLSVLAQLHLLAQAPFASLLPCC
uniref:Uncharacterized protein n=1 Tax=Zea mays TaxID=4577 RepID=B4G1Y8_MAIZE|nr:unknown [Zea mays]|eukprot:NP_001142389.1 goliath 1 [Zea mays]